jgi:hypothetical protein
MRTIHMTATILAALGIGAVAGAEATRAGRPITVVPAGEVKFTPRDPKNPNGPQTALLFGDFAKKGPVGFLLKVPAGFRPGPHIHTSDDHAVVVKGKMHNFAAGGPEGPGVETGGTWFQPGGVLHDNHCEDGSECVVFIYMPDGFDFKPAPAK